MFDHSRRCHSITIAAHDRCAVARPGSPRMLAAHDRRSRSPRTLPRSRSIAIAAEATGTSRSCPRGHATRISGGGVRGHATRTSQLCPRGHATRTSPSCPRGHAGATSPSCPREHANRTSASRPRGRARTSFRAHFVASSQHSFDFLLIAVRAGGSQSRMWPRDRDGHRRDTAARRARRARSSQCARVQAIARVQCLTTFQLTHFGGTLAHATTNSD